VGASIPEELKKRLDAAVADLPKNDAAANAVFADLIAELARSAVPAHTIATPATTIAELREEIKWQGDEFNQIDSKVGIVLGFILIFAGQLLTLFTTKRADIAVFLSALSQVPHIYVWLYIFVASIGAALVSGVWSRWPRDFRGSAIPPNPKDPTTGKENQLPADVLSEDTVLNDLYVAVRINRSTNKIKSRYGKLCNLFAAVSLLGVVFAIAGSIYQQQHATSTNPTGQTASPVPPEQTVPDEKLPAENKND
jgi:hypothetical protein